ncbi:hypothetical protein DJ90_6233 [Paenibacillus macerans]|uniref:Uncharacterized protein n=1 Tax=Paenibacillus macerans TaxID=44252 RepID=A0A090XT72_PAEMA|nr:hypothetical protein DJ90_6233 [Paenibacillus macerans]
MSFTAYKPAFISTSPRQKTAVYCILQQLQYNSSIYLYSFNIFCFFFVALNLTRYIFYPHIF